VSLETERDVIRQRLVAQWPTTAISWDGMNGAAYERQKGVAFIRPRVEAGDAEWVSISGATRKQRNYSTVVIEVYVPSASGSETAAQYCDALIAVFNAYSSGGVVFDRRAFAREIGPDVEHYKWMVFIPYYREEVA
jgi:hypothetical protein